MKIDARTGIVVLGIVIYLTLWVLSLLYALGSPDRRDWILFCTVCAPPAVFTFIAIPIVISALWDKNPSITIGRRSPEFKARVINE